MLCFISCFVLFSATCIVSLRDETGRFEPPPFDFDLRLETSNPNWQIAIVLCLRSVLLTESDCSTYANSNVKVSVNSVKVLESCPHVVLSLSSLVFELLTVALH